MLSSFEQEGGTTVGPGSGRVCTGWNHPTVTTAPAGEGFTDAAVCQGLGRVDGGGSWNAEGRRSPDREGGMSIDEVCEEIAVAAFPGRRHLLGGQ